MGAGEVADDLGRRDRDRHAHGKRPVADPVVVDHVLGLVLARRDLLELEQRHPLAVVHQRLDRPEHDIESVLVAEPLEPAFPEPE